MNSIDPISTGRHVVSLRYLKWRGVKDRAFRLMVAGGGIFVVVTLVLICLYLVSVVLPLFQPARMSMSSAAQLPATAGEGVVGLLLDEYSEVGFRLAQSGTYSFFSTQAGSTISAGRLTASEAQPVTAVALGFPSQRAIAAGDAAGFARIGRVAYDVTYPNGIERLITPRIDYPFLDTPVAVTASGNAVQRLTVQANDDEATVVAIDAGGQMTLTNLQRAENFFTEEVSVEAGGSAVVPFDGTRVVEFHMDTDQQELYLLDNGGSVHLVDIADKRAPRLVDSVDVTPGEARVTAATFLSGGVSLLLGFDDGSLEQWFPVRGADNQPELVLVREFRALPAAVQLLLPEHTRKGFVAIDAAGELGVYHATAHSRLLRRSLATVPVAAVMGRRANDLLLLGESDEVQVWQVDNPHPEVSLKSLWGQVWYENRQAPEYIWQSSSASSGFEPKFSLTPLTFGTLKAALYAMGFAIPLAILGAMYTAYFMSPRMRNIVKPSIEVMAALPTVILGFLAGLWFAPLVERHLPGVFLIILLLPLSCLVASLAWSRIPNRYTKVVPSGWEAALLVPVICLVTWLCIVISQPVEALFFGGDMPQWITQTLGMPYDQRNSLVVGVAVGIAVIPTIFSISEDAIYEVPRHLTVGSLALGATPWQTMVRVILLTASPGIFSAVMIGLGRAVGETMIVLMATGNTPILDLNIFQGFRALSANIAVEMPESELGSTHFRILFLAALVLFAITFAFNTLAEIVRQRLRVRYSNL